MTTTTETRPDTTQSGTSDDVFHYVRKGEMAQSAVEGSHVVALCGETFPVTKVFKKVSPVCTECKRIYRAMKP